MGSLVPVEIGFLSKALAANSAHVSPLSRGRFVLRDTFTGDPALVENGVVSSLVCGESLLPSLCRLFSKVFFQDLSFSFFQ